MSCPKCKSEQNCKDGKAQGRQRYLCKSCGMHYSVIKKSDVKSEEVRRLFGARDVFGRAWIQSHRSTIENKLRNGISMDKTLGKQSGAS